MPADTLRFTVIVPTLGRDEWLNALLDALSNQTLDRSRWNLVVSYDGAEPSAEIARRLEGMAATTIRNRERRGPGAARNAGAARAAGDYLAFTEDDCRPAPEWLERAWERLDREPAIDVLEGATLLPDGRAARRRAVDRLTWLPTNLFVRRLFFEAIGGYCERFFDPGTGVYFREDSDFGFTAMARGARVLHDDRPEVVHPREHSEWLDPLRWARRYEMDPLLAARHPEAFQEEIEVSRLGPFQVRRPFVRVCAGFVVGCVVAIALLALGNAGLASWFAALALLLLLVIAAKWRFEPKHLVLAPVVPVALLLALLRGRRRAAGVAPVGRAEAVRP